MNERPNFLVIMTEQHRGDCLGIDGHPVLLTPNIDNIGGAGVRFSRCYSTCPVCVPARRSFLSGQFPATHGLLSNSNMEWQNAPRTLPGVLRDAGYHTYWVGRSIHQYPPRKRYGFDHMVSYGSGTNDYDALLDRMAPEGHGGYYGTGVMHNDWTARPWHLAEPLHFTNWVVNEALRFLQSVRDPSCPFFLVASFLAAHPPLVPPAFYMERYLRMQLPEPAIGGWAVPPANDGIGDDVSAQRVKLTGEMLRSCHAGYYGLINHVDDQIRRLLNPVNGIDRMTNSNTVVFFTSDHGEMLGDHYLWRKSLPYEGSARIPLLIRGPGRFGFKRGLAIDRPVGIEDIMPTVLEMAGVEIPDTVDGQSLLPLIQGEDAQWRTHIHIEWKYIWFVKDGREQFFDLKQDPRECHDLIEEPAAVDRVFHWRNLLIEELRDRPEGFSDGKRLIAGRSYPTVLPHAVKSQ